METKSLLYGLIGFFIGGLIVSVAATTFNKPEGSVNSNATTMSEMSMSEMTAGLANKKGDDFDKEFITDMIAHHEGAIAMARLSPENAKHEEIKQLSSEIISAQEKEIEQMRQWQKDWGYPAASHSNSGH